MLIRHIIMLSALMGCCFMNLGQTAFAEQTMPIAPVHQVVNINKATIEQLMTLKHIGHKRAVAIIEYRKEHGAFKKIEDLANVKGISLSYVKAHRDLLTV